MPTELTYFPTTGYFYDVEAPLTGGSTSQLQFLVISAFITFTPRLPIGFTAQIAGLDLGNSVSGSASLAIAPVTARVHDGQLSTIDATDTPGIQLLANSAPIAAALAAAHIDTLIYDVSFTNVVYAEGVQEITNFAFIAPTDTTPICITDPTLERYVYQTRSQAAYALPPVPLNPDVIAPSAITGISTIGMELLTATDGATARTAIGIAGSGGDWERYANFAAFPVTGNTALEYLALDTNKIYTWNGSAYVLAAQLVQSTEITDATPSGRAALTGATVLNILGSSVSTGTSASQTTAIKNALDANPGKAFYFPPGDYRLDTVLNVTANNTLILAPGARIYAGAAMATLINYDNGQTATDSLAADKGVFGYGTLDGNLLASKILRVASVLRFTVDGLTFLDGINRGFLCDFYAAEVSAHNLRFANTGTTNVTDNVAIEVNGNDCRFSQIGMRDWTIGVWDKGANTWVDIHPWIGTTAQLTARYQNSVAFKLAGDSLLIAPYADTYRYSFQSAQTSPAYAVARLVAPRAYCASGNLTNGLAASYPGVIFYFTDAGGFFTVTQGKFQGHPVTNHAFTSGPATQLFVKNSLPASYVTGFGGYEWLTAAVWTSTNLVLGVNEWGTESDTGQFKIGDGTTPWNSLPYATSELTPTAQKASGYTAKVGEKVRCSGTFTVLLPANPVDKAKVGVDNEGTGTITVQRGGTTDVLVSSGGSATTAQITLPDQKVVLQYEASTGHWYFNYNSAPPASLDTRYQLIDSSGILLNPKMTQIRDSNGNAVIGARAVASAVNRLQVANAADGGAVFLEAAGSSSSTQVGIHPKNTGVVPIYLDSGNATVTVSAQGDDANISANITTTGTGTVQANGSPVNTPATIHAATTKATPVDADELPLVDSAASFGAKKLTWANLKATIKTYIEAVGISPRVSVIKDGNGNSSLGFNGSASAVNYVEVTNRATGNGPYMQAVGTDSNINFGFLTNGTGQFQFYTPSGTTTTIGTNGQDANQNLNLITPGTGKVKANGDEIVTLAAAQTQTNKTLTAPKVDVLASTAGSWVVQMTHGGSQNLLAMTNAATTVAPSIGVSSASGDSVVDLNLVTKSGKVTVDGTSKIVGVKVAVPASSSATGVPGQWAADSSWHYVCTATNTWVRSAAATW